MTDDRKPAGEGLPRRSADVAWFGLVLLAAAVFGIAGNLVGCTPYDVCSDAIYVANYGEC